MNSFLFSLIETTKSFLGSSSKHPESAPYVRSSVNIKRVMTIVVVALLPATFFAILNSGMLKVLYNHVNIPLMQEYITASTSTLSYFQFLFTHFFSFFWEGCMLFIPQLIIIYATGGLIEIFFASLKRKAASEGFFVTGLLFALILPPTLPYWMTIFGVSVGLILGKEIFGGTGMNIFNPALICRCILYFSFPSYMTGNIWAGSNSFVTSKNLITYNKEINPKSYDTITTASCLNISELPSTISRLQIDGLSLAFKNDVGLKKELVEKLFSFNPKLHIDSLTSSELIDFVTKGLNLPEDQLENAFHFGKLLYGIAPYTTSNLYFGNITGSFGETSKFATHIGMIFLLLTGIISFRIIAPAMLSAFLTAGCFYLFAMRDQQSPAHFALLPYKHLIMGGLSFGIVFMATDPVSSPTTKMGQIFYGGMIGTLTILIRLINPAFPEGVMLAILFGNTFAPLLDRIALRYRKKSFNGKIRQATT